MKQHEFPRGYRQQVRPVALKALVASLLSVGVLSAATVSAQQAETVVTVTGQRKAAQSAQTLKKNADQVVDSIVADDIGKFPDKNVAEILQRITGVQVTRGGGEAGTVIIRGLGGIVTLLNGREFFSDSGRSLYLADIPTTMLQRIDVYKTQGADQSEGGTAGVIDVRTNRPFDFKGATFNANARVENRDKADTNNPDVSTMASNRWKTGFGEVGALVGASFQRGQYHDEVAFAGTPVPYDGNTVGPIDFGRFMANGDRKREALNFALQWRPGSTVELFAEGFRTNIDHRYQNNFMLGFSPRLGRGATIVTRPGTNNVETITLLNQDNGGFVSTQAYQHDVVNQQYAVGGRWDVTPEVRVTSELATTKSDFKERRVILDFDYTAHGFLGAVRSGGGHVDFPVTDMTDPTDANFRIAGGKDIALKRNGKSVDWRADVIWDTSDNTALSFIKEVAGGVRLAERKADSLANLADAWLNFGPNQGKNVSNFPGLYTLSAPTGGRYGVNQYIVPDRDYMLDNTAEVRRILTGSTRAEGDDPRTYFDDVEKTSAIYAKAKFGFNLGVPVSGVLGARLVRTEQTLRGYSSVDNSTVFTPITLNTTRTDVLPSLALKLDFTPTLIGRVIAGKAIERPAFADYNPALRIGAPPTDPTRKTEGSAGNPFLRPTESTNVDVALEWYFANTGSLTGTVFRHNFVDRLKSSARPEVIGGQTYEITRTYNLTKASLQGAEVAYRQFYDGLPGILKGLGMEANFTYLTGKETNPNGIESDYSGLSKTSYNLVGLYENGDWSARLAYNWRSKFLSEPRYRNDDKLDLYVAPMKTLDGSLSYKISKKLTVTLDGNNLLDHPYHDYFNQDENMVRDTRAYDRAIGLALHYKY